MSGKSTYLRQIGLLTVMAMCGCFVPAEYASFRIHDALLTRLSNDDDMEKGLSTFAEEMSSSAMLLGLSTRYTLLLIDELGRGTSPREGLGISYAISEQLVTMKCFVFFATHFVDLPMLLSRKPSVVNLHLSVQRSQPSQSNAGLVYKYKIIDGLPDVIDNYGLDLARLADLPSDSLNEGRRISTKLSQLEANRNKNSESHKIGLRRKALLRLQEQLVQTFKHSTLPDQELLCYISRFQKGIAMHLRANLFVADISGED